MLMQQSYVTHHLHLKKGMSDTCRQLKFNGSALDSGDRSGVAFVGWWDNFSRPLLYHHDRRLSCCLLGLQITSSSQITFLLRPLNVSVRGRVWREQEGSKAVLWEEEEEEGEASRDPALEWEGGGDCGSGSMRRRLMVFIQDRSKLDSCTERDQDTCQPYTSQTFAMPKFQSQRLFCKPTREQVGHQRY